MTDLGLGRSADPFEELAGPVDDVHGGESRVALGGAALVREPSHDVAVPNASPGDQIARGSPQREIQVLSQSR